MDDFDDGYGDPGDYGMSQSDFDAATEVGRDTYNDNLGGDNSEQYNSAIENQTQKQAYTSMRGATATNPFPESFFSKLFGAENVSYTNILGGGQAGLNRVAEINDLRFRQSKGLPSLITGQPYQAGDFYIGQPTEMGVVKPIPDMASNIMSLLPGGGILNAMIPQKGLPENDPRYRAIMEEREKSANDPNIFDSVLDFVKEKTGFGPKDSGASLAASSTGDGQMRVPDTRTFDAFGNVTGSDLDTQDRFKTIEELAEERKKLNELYYGGSANGIGAINKEITDNAINNIVPSNMIGNSIIGNPNYSVNMRLNAGESLSDIVKSRTQ